MAFKLLVFFSVCSALFSIPFVLTKQERSDVFTKPAERRFVSALPPVLMFHTKEMLKSEGESTHHCWTGVSVSQPVFNRPL